MDVQKTEHGRTENRAWTNRKRSMDVQDVQKQSINVHKTEHGRTENGAWTYRKKSMDDIQKTDHGRTKIDHGRTKKRACMRTENKSLAYRKKAYRLARKKDFMHQGRM